jgi:hypothetical protein
MEDWNPKILAKSCSGILPKSGYQLPEALSAKYPLFPYQRGPSRSTLHTKMDTEVRDSQDFP